MKKIWIALLTTLTGVVLLFSYRTSTEAVTPTALADETAPSKTASTAPPASSAPANTPGPTPSESSASSSSSPASSASSTGLADGTYQGESTSTRWGPVQVQITVSGGKITDVQAIDYPSGNGRDQQINSYAIPILTSEALDAQSAQIDMVSGATVTSRGYITSLQSALDQAGA